MHDMCLLRLDKYLIKLKCSYTDIKKLQQNVNRVAEDPLQGDEQLGLGQQVPLCVLDQLGYILKQTTVSVDVDIVRPETKSKLTQWNSTKTTAYMQMKVMSHIFSSQQSPLRLSSMVS